MTPMPRGTTNSRRSCRRRAAARPRERADEKARQATTVAHSMRRTWPSVRPDPHEHAQPQRARVRLDPLAGVEDGPVPGEDLVDDPQVDERVLVHPAVAPPADQDRQRGDDEDERAGGSGGSGPCGRCEPGSGPPTASGSRSPLRDATSGRRSLRAGIPGPRAFAPLPGSDSLAFARSPRRRGELGQTVSSRTQTASTSVASEVTTRRWRPPSGGAERELELPVRQHRAGPEREIARTGEQAGGGRVGWSLRGGTAASRSSSCRGRRAGQRKIKIATSPDKRQSDYVAMARSSRVATMTRGDGEAGRWTHGASRQGQLRRGECARQIAQA